MKEFFRRQFPWTSTVFSPKSSQKNRGVALLLAIFTMVLISYIVVEISYDSAVEFNVNSQGINSLKAYYAARAGVELSLLRIKIYGKIQSQFGKQIPAQQKGLLDLIWKFPFGWPPEIPKETNSVDKDQVAEKVKESQMDATYMAVISEEGSKIDLNDLSSPSQTLRDNTKSLLQQVYDTKMQNDDEFSRAHQGFDFPHLLNAIADWETKDKTSANGGAKNQFYANLGSDDPSVQYLPPNRGFRTLAELHMVAGMTDDIYQLVVDNVTVYGMHAINPNFASAEVLMSLDPSITKEVAQQIVTRRDDEKSGGPFEKDTDFWAYVNSVGGRVSQQTEQKIPLTFDGAVNFRIKSTGSYGNVTREITAIVYDVNSSITTISAQVKKDKAAAAANGGAAPPPNTPPQNPSPSSNLLPKGPPRIVYWNER